MSGAPRSRLQGPSRAQTHASERLVLGSAPCALGVVLVAKGGTGLRAILLGDELESLLADCRRRFLDASTRLEPGALASDLPGVVRLVDDPWQAPKLDLDPRGTDFQLQVWNELREIPVGQTVSYQELARRLGRPKASRAVAQACGANPLAVAIPCHRVLRSDGSLSGYRWGLERKQALLDKERVGIGQLGLRM